MFEYFSRCDVPWQDTKPISPAYCETVFQKDGSKTLRINMERALIDFQHGFDASIVRILLSKVKGCQTAALIWGVLDLEYWFLEKILER